MTDKIVLVTGAGGFVGQHVLQSLLDLGYRVHGVSRKHTWSVSQVQWHSCDLLDVAATDKLLAEVRPSHLMHIAWYTEHRKYWTAPENTAWLEASTHLFEKFIAQGGRRILGVGSCAEYDWQRRDRALWKETEACQPQTFYGQTKLALLQRLSALPVKSYVWARIFMLFGPGEKRQRLVPYVIRSALAGDPVLCTDGAQIRDFMDARLCGLALTRALDSNVVGPVNIGSGEAISVGELVKLICEGCNYSKEIKFGAVTMNKTDPLFMVPDLSRLHHEVGFRERQDLSQSLSEMVAWYRKHLPIGYE